MLSQYWVKPFPGHYVGQPSHYSSEVDTIIIPSVQMRKSGPKEIFLPFKINFLVVSFAYNKKSLFKCIAHWVSTNVQPGYLRPQLSPRTFPSFPSTQLRVHGQQREWLRTELRSDAGTRLLATLSPQISHHQLYLPRCVPLKPSPCTCMTPSTCHLCTFC